MTEHLPECQPESVPDPPFICICPELRACEERAIAAAVQRVEELREKYTPGYSAYKNLSVTIAAIKGDQP